MSMQQMVLFSLLAGAVAAGVAWFGWEFLENVAAMMRSGTQEGRAKLDVAGEHRGETRETETKGEAAKPRAAQNPPK